jgi:hypothetical protein
MTQGHLLLRAYFELPENRFRGSKQRFAKAIGVVPYTLSRYLNPKTIKDRPGRPEIAYAIERETEKYVPAETWIIKIEAV